MPRAGASPRLERLLVLVPWVMAHPGTTVDEVCARFKITREELVEDLDLLFVCGLPPFGPGDLIIAMLDGDQVVIQAADYLARPMRLTRGEGVALLVMGRALSSVSGLEEAESLHRALAKLEDALSPDDAQAAADLAARVAVELEGTGAEPLLGDLREAIAENRRVHITYYSFGRDELTERRIDPYVVFAAQGNWYVLAHDHASEESRVFRVDRIRDLTPTGETFSFPDGFDPQEAARSRLFVPSPRDVEVVVDLGPGAAWVLEITPHERAEPLDDGWTRMWLRTPHLEWVERLVLRAGDQIRVVAPPELAEGVRSTARRALEGYAATRS